MVVRSCPRYKYVYPALLFLLLLLFLLQARAARAGDVIAYSASGIRSRPGIVPSAHDAGRINRQLQSATEALGARFVAPGNQCDLEICLQRREAVARSIEESWFDQFINEDNKYDDRHYVRGDSQAASRPENPRTP